MLVGRKAYAESPVNADDIAMGAGPLHATFAIYTLVVQTFAVRTLAVYTLNAYRLSNGHIANRHRRRGGCLFAAKASAYV